VTDASTGQPIPGHQMFVFADSNSMGGYFNLVTTDAQGFYEDQIYNLPAIPDTMYVGTMDCNGAFLVETVLITPTLPLVVDFALTGCNPSSNCQASFSFTCPISNPCALDFHDQSSGSPDSWYWDFGDGNSSTQQNPSHIYTVSGTYTVTLVTNSSVTGCSDTTTQSVTVHCNTGGACVADFIAIPDTLPNSIFFLNTSTGNFTSVIWDFGDGNSSTQFDAHHVYAMPGTYTVTLTIFDSLSQCFDVISIPVVVSGSGTNCQADFVAIPDTLGLGVFFSNTSTGNFTDVVWDFGDGNTSTQLNPYHIYAFSGTYTVTLSVFNNLSQCYDIITYSVTVGNQGPCDAEILFFVGGTGLDFQFYNVSTGAFTQSHWDFGDGTTSTQMDPVHTFSGPGVYVVTLTISDPLTGCSDSAALIITIPNMPNCSANFTVQVDSNGVANFVASFSGNAGIMSAIWDFGDGATGSGMNISHTYPQSGNYWACVTITDSLGCSDTYCGAVYIPNPNGLYNIGGTVYYPVGPGGPMPADDYMVYLVELDQATLTLTAVDSQTVTILDSGFYLFTGVPSGSYTVKAALNPAATGYASHIPTYYEDELFWSNANYVALFNDRYDVDIYLVQGNNPGGPGFIGGSVLAGANKTEGDPLHDIEIILLDMNDNPITYTYSDIDGGFEFPNLAYGTYKVYTEVMNKQTIPEIVTISAATPTIDDVQIEVHSTVITGVDVESSLYFNSVSDLYPNPTAASASFDLELKDFTHLKIQVLNTVGQEVLHQEADYGSGNHTIDLDTEALDVGMYFISIVADNEERVVLKLVKQ